MTATIRLRELTKRYADVTAVDALTLDVEPGRVTGFLGPNGAGKSTTMRLVMGLDTPTQGAATIGSAHYRDLPVPLRVVGALLDANAAHPGRSARAHLAAMAHPNGIGRDRVEEVLETVGLSAVARKRVGGFSLGMKQRLGIAGALLGDPGVLLFDEPVNGLDPDGVRWVRDLVRSLAADGRTVFVSSHLMSEMERTADHLVVIGRGRLILDAPLDRALALGVAGTVRVRTGDPDQVELLARHLRADDAATVTRAGRDLLVDGTTVDVVGDRAHRLGIRLHGLATERSSLEDTYMDLTRTSVEFGASGRVAGSRAGRGTADTRGPGSTRPAATRQVATGKEHR